MESWATIQGKSSRVGAAGWRALPSRDFCEDARRLQSEGPKTGRRDPKTPFGPRFFSGGWFGCHQFYVPIYKGFISSSRNWRSHIFQRGGLTQAPSSFSFSPNPRGIQDDMDDMDVCQDQSEMRDRHLKNEYMQDVVCVFLFFFFPKLLKCRDFHDIQQKVACRWDSLLIIT